MMSAQNRTEQNPLLILTFGKDLSGFLFRNALDLLEHSSRGVCDRLDGIEATLDDELDVSLCKSGNSLKWPISYREKRGSRWTLGTSSAESGVGAPGPVVRFSSPLWLPPKSSTCVISVKITRQSALITTDNEKITGIWVATAKRKRSGKFSSVLIQARPHASAWESAGRQIT